MRFFHPAHRPRIIVTFNEAAIEAICPDTHIHAPELAPRLTRYFSAALFTPQGWKGSDPISVERQPIIQEGYIEATGILSNQLIDIAMPDTENFIQTALRNYNMRTYPRSQNLQVIVHNALTYGQT